MPNVQKAQSAPLTAADIQDMMKNPNSQLYQAVAGFLAAVHNIAVAEKFQTILSVIMNLLFHHHAHRAAFSADSSEDVIPPDHVEENAKEADKEIEEFKHLLAEFKAEQLAFMKELDEMVEKQREECNQDFKRESEATHQQLDKTLDRIDDKIKDIDTQLLVADGSEAKRLKADKDRLVEQKATEIEFAHKISQFKLEPKDQSALQEKSEKVIATHQAQVAKADKSEQAKLEKTLGVNLEFVNVVGFAAKAKLHDPDSDANLRPAVVKRLVAMKSSDGAPLVQKYLEQQKAIHAKKQEINAVEAKIVNKVAEVAKDAVKKDYHIPEAPPAPKVTSTIKTPRFTPPGTK